MVIGSFRFFTIPKCGFERLRTEDRTSGPSREYLTGGTVRSEVPPVVNFAVIFTDTAARPHPL